MNGTVRIDKLADKFVNQTKICFFKLMTIILIIFLINDAFPRDP